MARVISMDETAILALFDTKREEDLATFGSASSVENSAALVAAQGILVAQNHTDVLAAQASVTALAATVAQQGITVCTSTTRPGSPFVDQKIRETDTGAKGFWNGSAWIMTDSVEQSYNPVLTSAGGTVIMGAGNIRNGRYRRNNGECHYYGTIYTGTTGWSGGSASLRISLPFKSKTASVTRFGTASINARTNDHQGVSRIDPDQTFLTLMVDYLDTATYPSRVVMAYVANADGSAGVGTGVPRAAGVYTFSETVPGYLNWDLTYEANYAVPGP